MRGRFSIDAREQSALRILITGATGFVGYHLIQHLRDTVPDAAIHGTSLFDEEPRKHVTLHTIDLREPDAVHQLIKQTKPQQIYHLAAQAFVPRSFEDPWETLENNIRSQLNIIQACIQVDLQPRILIVSSAEIYGPVQPEELPLTESAPLRPTSPYSVSKITQDMLALQYFLSHNLPIFRARPFNHFGPGQNENFVAPAFALQIARIEARLNPPKISVGDLSARRDFTDVRDIVRAYRLIVEKGQPGDVYNVASGTAYSIESLLNHLLKQANVKIETSVDPERLRPTTIPILQGDATRLTQATGWKPQISFEQSLSDILDDCRTRVNRFVRTSR